MLPRGEAELRACQVLNQKEENLPGNSHFFTRNASNPAAQDTSDPPACGDTEQGHLQSPTKALGSPPRKF